MKDGWDIVFADGSATGTTIVNKKGAKKETKLELKKTEILSPTLGEKPPAGATVVFDGSSFDMWEHEDERTKVTWRLTGDGAMEVVSKAWNNKQNQKDGIGGYIRSKKKFGDLKCHIEFRYPVGAGKSGQARGNSGFFFDKNEIQVLNSYALIGYWNECGAIYKKHPPKVNAAAPPLQWQSYDVEIDFPESGDDDAIFTVRLNGQLIHNKIAIQVRENTAHIRLQDHGNAIQYRNIWVVELGSQRN